MEKKISLLLMMGLLLLICPFTVTAASDAVLVFHFDEGSGSVAHDASGHGNDGAIYGATWVDGISGKALSFDGYGDWVENSLNAPLTDMTIMLWMKSSLTTSYQQRIADVATSSDIGLQLCMFTDGRLLIDNSGGPSPQAWAVSAFNDGMWHQVVGVRDGNAYRLYIDGEYASATTGSTPHYSRLFLGKRAARSNEYFNGIIDEVAIYQRALSPSEIQLHYLAKRADPTPIPTPTTITQTTTIPTPTKPAIAASLTKSINPQSVKQNQTVTITVTIENTGTTPLSDIEAIDKVPSEFIFLSGDTQSAYSSLKPGESRTIQYTIQSNGAGKFMLDAATARYADQSGNYTTVNSNIPTLEVLTPLADQPITTKAPGFQPILCVGGMLAAVLIFRKLK
jgi:uncharacterized repeat protein (TIGR01451 family)